jgi:hypothetical protein
VTVAHIVNTSKEIATMEDEKIVAYKAFGADMTCRGFRYEIGQTYECEGEIAPCRNGFHACERPIDVFGYYPTSSRFAEVLCEDRITRYGDKLVCAKITVTAEIGLSDMIERTVRHVMGAANWIKGKSATGSRGAASATGDGGAASATGDGGAASATGSRGAASATGSRGAASATGYSGAASATGSRGAASATGYASLAIAGGRNAKARASEGSAIFLVERDQDWSIVAVFAAIAGRDGIKPDTWYSLEGGEPVEVN